MHTWVCLERLFSICAFSSIHKVKHTVTHYVAGILPPFLYLPTDA